VTWTTTIALRRRPRAPPPRTALFARSDDSDARAREIERREHDEHACAPDRGEGREDAAAETEQRALEQRGADHRRAVCTERPRHGELVLALRRARGQNRGQVHHQHQREQQAGEPQHEERRPDGGQ
jgi:hypothetical protein